MTLFEQGNILDDLIDVLFGFFVRHLSVQALETRKELDMLSNGHTWKETVMLQANPKVASDSREMGAQVLA